ncbi:UNVERIFIED_ORG: hypothetical protein ABIC43_002234 [Variovorax guangxiensis]
MRTPSFVGPFKMTDFSLHFPTGLAEPTLDDNVDVHIKLRDGRAFAVTFFTVSNLTTLMTRWGRTGECAHGLYVWATNMIVVQEISQAVIRRVAQDLVETGQIESVGHLIHSAEHVESTGSEMND